MFVPAFSKRNTDAKTKEQNHLKIENGSSFFLFVSAVLIATFSKVAMQKCPKKDNIYFKLSLIQMDECLAIRRDGPGSFIF